MPGKRSIENGDYVTRRALYRRDLDASVAGESPESDSIPILSTDKSPQELLNFNAAGARNSDSPSYGRNAQIDLSVIYEGFTDVTLQVWMKAPETDVELTEEGSSESSDSPLFLPTTQDWVFVEEKTIDKSTFWAVKDIPPGDFKVIVSAVTGTGTIHILEQHAN